MAFGKILLLAVIVAGYSTASPIRSESYDNAAFGPSILIQDSIDPEDKQIELSHPATYALFFGPFYPSDTHELQKRSAEESELEDLETAAGTNALRPLFVYRQQVAYRQRLREAIRRRNRF